MTKTKKICDRCGAVIEHRYPIIQLKKRETKILTLAKISDEPYDYLEISYDICPKCKKEFEKWMEGKQ